MVKGSIDILELLRLSFSKRLSTELPPSLRASKYPPEHR